MTVESAPRSCGVADETLFEFSLGDVPVDLAGVAIPEPDIDAHVSGCDECQAFLAELWEGSLDKDLSEPVLKIIELELFLIELAKLGGGILASFAEALLAYALEPEAED